MLASQRRSKAGWLRAGSLVVGITLVLLGTAQAAAQVFRLGTWEGTLDGVTDFARQDTKTGGSQRARLESLRNDDRLTLRNSGAYLYDPGLRTLSLGGTFGFSQEEFKTESGSASRQGTLSGYDVFMGILSEQPFALNLFANRSQSFVSRELAGRSEVVTENRGGTLFARRVYIPSSLAFRQELHEETSRTGDIEAHRENQRRIVTYEGQRGWTDSETDLRYEFIDDADRVFPRLSYRSHEGSLNYSLDFGSELNWRWDSRLRHFIRTGVADVTTSTVDELLRIDHTERLRTEYRYFLTRTESLAVATTTHTGAATLLYRLYESLTSTAGADAIVQMLPAGQKDAFRGRLDFAYAKRLPWEGRLTAGLGGSLQYEDDRFMAVETGVPQETHTAATPFALPIPLANSTVIASSVVITKTAVGPLPPGCIAPPGPPTPLVLGQDYTLRTVGDITEVVPIPCAGVIPGINPGDTIAVDYRFETAPSRTFTTATWRADVSVDYRWVRPYFIHEQTDQSLLSGRDGRFLDDQQSDTLGIEFRYDGVRLRGSLLAEVRRFESTRVTFNSVRSAQSLGFSILPELVLSLSADEARIDYENPKRQTQTLTGRVTLTHALGTSLFTEATAGIRILDDTLIPKEQTTEAALKVRWLYRKLEVSPRLEFFDRQRGDTVTKEYRAMLFTSRRF